VRVGVGRSLGGGLAAGFVAEPEEEAAEEGEGEDGERDRGDEVGEAALVVVEAGPAHGAGARELGDEREEDGEDGGRAAHR
jgi:hypothetical protein